MYYVCICFAGLSVGVCQEAETSVTRRGTCGSEPQLFLQPCIFLVTQPEIAPLWQFIYYSQASRFCLYVCMCHTHMGGGVSPPL